jgi:hypothetical protein
MRLPFRRRRTAALEIAEAALPALRTEEALLMIAVQSRQLHHRMARMEQRFDELIEAGGSIEIATIDDLLQVQLHSARVSAEVTRIAVQLQARIDDLAAQMPAVVAEDRRQQRARMLAESIMDLSDAMDTAPVDVRDRADEWAATA